MRKGKKRGGMSYLCVFSSQLTLIFGLVSHLSLMSQSSFLLTHMVINLAETPPVLFLIYSTIFSHSLACLGQFLLLLPFTVAPIVWSLRPFGTLFLFFLSTLALPSWTQWCFVFHLFCLFTWLTLRFVHLYITYFLIYVSMTLSRVLISLNSYHSYVNLWFSYAICKFQLPWSWSELEFETHSDLHIYPSFIRKRLQGIKHLNLWAACPFNPLNLKLSIWVWNRREQRFGRPDCWHGGVSPWWDQLASDIETLMETLTLKTLYEETQCKFL